MPKLLIYAKRMLLRLKEFPTLCYLLIVLLIIYVWQITRKFMQILRIKSCLNTLHAFIYSATPSHYGPTNKRSAYTKCMNKVLKKYPDISEFTSYYSPSLSYGDHSDETYKNSIRLYQELLMKKNYLLKDFRQSLNPISAIKLIIALPSTLVRFIGFKPKETATKFLNLIGWILAYFLNIYSAEIKEFISSLLKLQ